MVMCDLLQDVRSCRVPAGHTPPIRKPLLSNKGRNKILFFLSVYVYSYFQTTIKLPIAIYLKTKMLLFFVVLCWPRSEAGKKTDTKCAVNQEGLRNSAVDEF